MGWACRKSGIVVTRGQRLTGGATSVALQSIAAVVDLWWVSWRPPLAIQHQTVINRSSAPPLLLPLLFQTNTRLSTSFVPCSKSVLRQACNCPPTPCFAAEGCVLILTRHSHQAADQPTIRPSRLTQKSLSAPRAFFLKSQGFGSWACILSPLPFLLSTTYPLRSSSPSLQSILYRSEKRPT